MPPLIAAIDQGTTSTRCMLFDRAGHAVAGGQAEHRQITPRPGWVEHDPIEIWQRTQDVVREAIRKADVAGSELPGVGITNQRETTVIWDRRTGKPYGNAIVWQDTRTSALCDELAREGGVDRFRAATGLPIATYFAGPKIRWALDHFDDLREAAKRGHAIAGTIDTWLIWNLTGGPDGGKHVTDVTNASRTLLMNLDTLDWDDELCRAIGVPRAMLPTIARSSDPTAFGVTRADGPFDAELPIAGVLGDQQAALVGQCCFDIGDMKNTYGTGCFLLANTGPKPIASRHGLITTVAYAFGDDEPVYALEGSVAIAGALVQWLRDNLKLIEKSSEIEALARSVDDTAGVHIVPAFSGLFAPYWRADARGIICGLTRMADRAHLARAALEAVCFQSCDVIDAMRQDAGVELGVLKVDGGMTVNDLLMQLQADLLGADVVRPKVTETTALGAAYAAGLATGFFAGLDDLRQHWQADRTFAPGIGNDEREARRADWRKAVERSLGWAE